MISRRKLFTMLPALPFVPAPKPEPERVTLTFNKDELVAAMLPYILSPLTRKECKELHERS